jgi:hypothetical protein
MLIMSMNGKCTVASRLYIGSIPAINVKGSELAVGLLLHEMEFWHVLTLTDHYDTVLSAFVVKGKLVAFCLQR